ncbi:membrane lipoprotein lipid attachment site-containing protein [Candidatus Falkowbacteria bacterium]|nr:membrane lipoprotein lipid attachment site-containing protein [Candidatus Falkowbacteria bacterium]
MKKLLVVFFALALLAGCGGGNQAAKKDVFTSIRDAITKNIALRCEYTDESGNTSINYIKGNMIRVDNEVEGKIMHALMRDEKVYIWSDDSTDGFLMDMRGLETSDDFKMGEDVVHDTEDIIAKLESQNKCKAEGVPDSYFEVPNGINFVDWSKLFQQMGQ